MACPVTGDDGQRAVEHWREPPWTGLSRRSSRPVAWKDPVLAAAHLLLLMKAPAPVHAVAAVAPLTKVKFMFSV